MAYESLPLFPHAEPEKPHRGLTPTQAAYLAGLLDGEGHFGMQYVHGGKIAHKAGYKYHQYFITLVMTNKPLLEAMAALVPWGKAGLQRGNYTLRGRAKPSWRIKWVGTIAARICRAIFPYVRLKKRHVELIIWLDNGKACAVKERPAGRGGSKYPAYIKDMHVKAHAEFRMLNARGQNNEPV